MSVSAPDTSDAVRRPVAIVTGASSGIGAATAARLARDGFGVVAAARRRDRLDALAAEHPGVRAATLDVTDPASVEALAADLPDVALLVANAGGAHGTDPVEHGRDEDWQAMFDVNVLGVLRTVRALLPALEAGDGGTIVVTGSIAGHLVYEGGGGYTAAKHAVTALVETLRLEPERPSGARLRDRPRHGAHRGVLAGAAARRPGCCRPRVRRRRGAAGGRRRRRRDRLGGHPPPHVNVDLLVVKPLAQAAPHKVDRRGGRS
ncbi:oxidoreductase [Angustibacter aerolatus]|uniref:Oxidoreductase n=1 Tax=Angustibacter aerolatus TaxID=1162965 RepID=A0ABQ6JLS1_9ACTN|nr:SDR family oxidoreductase [Angustibacter aerolatus]GMA89188.1 oxidoreductase [Angustibacter aerolatus]